MTEVSGQKSAVSSQKSGFIGGFTFSPLPFALSFFGALLFALCQSAEAQQPTKVSRLGYLSIADAATDSPRAEGLRLALRELGYIDCAVHEQIDKALIPGENSNTWKVQSAVPNTVRATISRKDISYEQSIC